MPKLDLPAKYLNLLQGILNEFVPHCDVWAYGSRVNGDNHDASDLDLVIRQPESLDVPLEAHLDLQEALIESLIPISIQVMDWAVIPHEFKKEIAKKYVVMQSSKHSNNNACGR